VENFEGLELQLDHISELEIEMSSESPYSFPVSSPNSTQQYLMTSTV